MTRVNIMNMTLSHSIMILPVVLHDVSLFQLAKEVLIMRDYD
jgi:hypothetical protein